MNANVEISVLTPIYNHKIEYVRKCLESLSSQTFENIEFLLIDNGADEKSKQLIKEFVEKDSRFKDLHIKVNKGVAKALNLGLDNAEGKYIGIVESDDWAFPDMYQKLYDQIKKFDADVCISGFCTYSNNVSSYKNGLTKEIFSSISDDKLFSILDFPFLYTCHQSMWCKLYKTDLIKSIRFSETGKYIDSQFMTEVFARTNKIIGLKDFVYNYRIDNTNASNSDSKNDKSLMYILDDWIECKKIIKERGLYDALKEEFYYQASKASYRFYKNIKPKYRKKFYKKWKKFVSDLKNDSLYSFKYLDAERKEFFINLFNNNYKGTLKYIDTNRGLSFAEKIFSVKNSSGKTHKVINILGLKIKIKRKIKINPLDILYRIENKAIIDHRNIYALINKYYFLQKSNILAAQIHPKSFSPYANCYHGKELVVFASGPTSKYYSSALINAPHIGVNRSFFSEKVKLDYLFIQDHLENDMEKANNYPCQKFYGKIPDRRYSQTKNGLLRITNIDLYESGANNYILEDFPQNNWADNLAVEPIGDWCGCVFSALQFAMYTNPKRIYLVGCDCSDLGHFYPEPNTQFLNNKTSNLSYQKKSWEAFKAHYSKFLPNVEIVSINPVGLKGMFKDIYTQSYIDEHPELLNENIEIINISEKKELVNT